MNRSKCLASLLLLGLLSCSDSGNSSSSEETGKVSCIEKAFDRNKTISAILDECSVSADDILAANIDGFNLSSCSRTDVVSHSDKTVLELIGECGGSSSSVMNSSSSVAESSSSTMPESSSSGEEVSSSSVTRESSSSAIESSSSLKQSSSSENPESSSSDTAGTFTDERDNKEYQWVKIGTQTWMAENLNYVPEIGNYWCYNNLESNCIQYGRLYDWDTAMEVCPTGWHLPDNDEWDILVDFAGGSSVAGTKLKSASGWNGTDDYGFNALPGGNRYIGGGIYDPGDSGYWWSATEGNDTAYYQFIYNDDENVFELNIKKSYAYSVRCVKN